jgi:penicillin G amidase
MFATSDDHIGYAQFGVNPKRPKNRLGSYISDGTSSKNDWLGTFPPQDRVIVIDPQDGYLVTSNNRPASSNFMGGYFDTTVFTARATRLEELIKEEIESGRKINLEFAQKTLRDTVDIYCRQILP